MGKKTFTFYAMKKVFICPETAVTLQWLQVNTVEPWLWDVSLKSDS